MDFLSQGNRAAKRAQMKLRRYRNTAVKATGQKSISTAGWWGSADHCWSFFRFHEGWMIHADRPKPLGTPTDYEGEAARAKLLQSTGLDKAYFKTRRDAVAAVELLLAGASG